MWFKSPRELLIISHDGATPRHFSFSAKTLNILSLLAIGLILIGGLLSVLHIINYGELVANKNNYNIAIQKKEILESKIERLHYKIEHLQTNLRAERTQHLIALTLLNDKLNEMRDYYANLRIIAGYKLSEEQIISLNNGQGGVVSHPLGLLNEDEITFSRGINQFEAMLIEEFTQQSKNFDYTTRVLSGRPTILYEIPSKSPIKNGWVFSGFGYRRSPWTGKLELHQGVDIPSALGTPVYAPACGIVIYIGWRGGYGRCLEVNHGGGISTLYAHLSSYNVCLGDRISQNDIIAYMGSTGRSTGSHLHYEVRKNGLPVNPMPYLAGSIKSPPATDSTFSPTIVVQDTLN